MLWSAGTTSLNRRSAHGQVKHSPGKMFSDYTQRNVVADQTPPISCVFNHRMRWTEASGCCLSSTAQTFQPRGPWSFTVKYTNDSWHSTACFGKLADFHTAYFHPPLLLVFHAGFRLCLELILLAVTWRNLMEPSLMIWSENEL